MPVLIVLVLLAAVVAWLDHRHWRRTEAERAVRLAAARAALTGPVRPLDAYEADAWRRVTTTLNDLEP